MCLKISSVQAILSQVVFLKFWKSAGPQKKKSLFFFPPINLSGASGKPNNDSTTTSITKWWTNPFLQTWEPVNLTETNIAHENPIFPGKYHQNGGFSMAMLVYKSLH